SRPCPRSSASAPCSRPSSVGASRIRRRSVGSPNGSGRRRARCCSSTTTPATSRALAEPGSPPTGSREPPRSASRWPNTEARGERRPSNSEAIVDDEATRLVGGGVMSQEHLESEVARLRAENEALKARAQRGGGHLRVSDKGGVSVYGLGRFPVTL